MSRRRPAWRRFVDREDRRSQEAAQRYAEIQAAHQVKIGHRDYTETPAEERAARRAKYAHIVAECD